eukprot:GHRQ01034244.1.p1 GENE.GHRQ01034244.1~~GHRQ01034244.1.p1  ORF type:complete len:139 (+),score=17.71 GHRQ01034244.1:131-547(+)
MGSTAMLMFTRSMLHSMNATKHSSTIVQRRRQPDRPSRNCNTTRYHTSRDGRVSDTAGRQGGGQLAAHQHQRPAVQPSPARSDSQTDVRAMYSQLLQTTLTTAVQPRLARLDSQTDVVRLRRDACWCCCAVWRSCCAT